MANMFNGYSTDEGSRMAVEMQTKREQFWSGLRKKNALKLFHETARRVPAYKDFLKKHRVNPAKIKTFGDFEFLPQTSKKEYLKQYPLEKLCWDGSLEKPLVFTSTSGSTGAPFYFPRGEQLDWEYSILAERFLLNSSYGARTSTLVIVGFGMGVWIGGIITYKAFELASKRGYPVSIITPGLNKAEIFHAFRELSPHYGQTIFIGYPPFMKDLLDEAASEGINLKKIHLRLFSAAEAYTEKFRDYLVRKAGIKNVYLDILNIYGTADIGAMAWETPTTILIRRIATQKRHVFQAVFSKIDKTPTLAQYNPSFITFESPNGEILLTGNNTVPLIRYAIGDHGGTLEFKEMSRRMNEQGISLVKEARRIGIGKPYELPFVYVYERNDFSTKLYGAIIHPEPIREALQDEQLEDFFTGKFTLMTKFDKKQNEFMEIHIELKPRIKVEKGIKNLCAELILSQLLKSNAEYRNNYTSIPSRVTPRLVFWQYEHPLHFSRGIKQRWVKKETR